MGFVLAHIEDIPVVALTIMFLTFPCSLYVLMFLRHRVHTCIAIVYKNAYYPYRQQQASLYLCKKHLHVISRVAYVIVCDCISVCMYAHEMVMIMMDQLHTTARSQSKG